MASMLHNSLVDALVVVGMDDQTSLLPMPKMSAGGNTEDLSTEIPRGPYQTNVLGVLTGTVALFPCQMTQVPGNRPFPNKSWIAVIFI